MKKTIQIIVLAALCFFLSSAARAQTTPLKIGDLVPDITINNIINYKTTSAKLSDFKGKLLILDFWATWCGACVFTFPKTDSLQKAFEGKIQFLPIAYQAEREIIPFIQRIEKSKGLKIITAMGDKELSKLFPHHVFPHYVWIGTDGRVQAITSNEALSTEVIQGMLNGTAKLAVKKDIRIPYDKNKPLLIDKNGSNGGNMLYRSLLIPYAEGLSGGYTVRTDSIQGRRLTVRNLALNMMFWVAYSDQGSFNNSNTILDVADPSRLKSSAQGAAYDYWKSQGNAFSYELIVPPHEGKNIYRYMQEDMQRYFKQYTAAVEKKPSMAYVLVRTDTADRLASSGGERLVKTEHLGAQLRNSTLSVLMNQLRNFYMQNSPYPLLDETGYKGRIDMDLMADLSDMKLLNAELSKYGLTFIRAEREVKLLLIRDRVQEASKNRTVN